MFLCVVWLSLVLSNFGLEIVFGVWCGSVIVCISVVCLLCGSSVSSSLLLVL